MSTETEFLPDGPLANQLFATINRLEAQRLQALAAAKAAYAEIFGRRHAPQPGDGPALWAAACVCFPLLDRPEFDRDERRLGIVRRDFEAATELDRLATNVQTLADRADELEREAKALADEADQLCRSTAGAKGVSAVHDRRDASNKAYEAKQLAEDKRKRANKAAEELRIAQQPHARLCGRNW